MAFYKIICVCVCVQDSSNYFIFMKILSELIVI